MTMRRPRLQQRATPATAVAGPGPVRLLLRLPPLLLLLLHFLLLARVHGAPQQSPFLVSDDEAPNTTYISHVSSALIFSKNYIYIHVYCMF